MPRWVWFWLPGMIPVGVFMTWHALGSANGVPEDCETMAYSELSDLQARIDAVLAKNGELKLDPYSRAHLAESSARIKKVLEARLQMSRP